MDDFFFFFFFDEETGVTKEIPVEQLGLNPNDFEFFGGNVRKGWHKQHEKWYFSVVDAISVLTESENPQTYWRVLKKRLKDEGNETVTNCNGLKLPAKDGKMRKTDMADMEQMLRLIQSIPSPKAEPFKVWLAKVGSERIDELSDPEIAIDRAISIYKKQGKDAKWIAQRLRVKEVRNELTNEWQRSGITDPKGYATLTDIMTKEWSGKTTRQYKDFKGLKKENLRDNMTGIELALNLLAEASTTEISKVKNPNGLNESKVVAKEGGSIAGNARKDLESSLGKTIISPLNSKDILSLDDGDAE